MSVLTDKSFVEAIPNTLDIFQLPPYQTSILQHYYVNVRPLSAITDSSPVEFLISNGGSDYVDLRRTRPHVKLRFTHADGSLLTDKEHIAPTNLFLQALWSQVAVYFQGQLVSSSNGSYPFKAMIQTLLEYGRDAKTSQLQSQLFYKDTGDNEADIESTDSITGGSGGLADRGNFIAKSKTLTMSGPILEDMFNFSRHLVNGVDINIKMFRSSSAFSLMSGVKDQEYTIELQDAYLKVCKLGMNNALVLAHAKEFETKNALYPHIKTEVKMVSVSASQISYTLDNVFLDHCPTRVVVGLVKGESVNGSYTGNAFNFSRSQFKSVGLYLDGVSVPGRSIETDDVEAYVNLFEGTNTWRKDQGNKIERTEFQLGNALFVFNLEPLAVDDEYLNLAKSGNLRLELQFKSSLTSTLNVIALSFNPSLLEIDATRNVFLK